MPDGIRSRPDAGLEQGAKPRIHDAKPGNRDSIKTGPAAGYGKGGPKGRPVDCVSDS